MSKMKNLFIKSCIIFLVIIGSTIPGKSQETFARKTDIPDGKCVVYIGREPSLNGAASQVKVRAWEIYDDYFNYDEKARIYVPYAKLDNKEYVPVILDANKIYRLHVSFVGIIYFKADSGSETIIKVSGASSKFASISGTSYFKEKPIINKNFEKKLLSDASILKELKEDTESKLIPKLMKMTISDEISGFIEKRK